jgi:hypothetical protein
MFDPKKQFQSNSRKAIPEKQKKAGVAHHKRLWGNSRPPLELLKKKGWSCAFLKQLHNSRLLPLKGGTRGWNCHRVPLWGLTSD